VNRELKAEHKRIKRLVKQEPSLFARLASIELSLGMQKAAKRRLLAGLRDFPDQMSARIVLAECLSLQGEHEASLKEWEEVIHAEPFNQKARAGYIQELAFLERTDALSDALAELYLVDPFDQEIEGRHKELLLQAIRKRHPSIRAWHSQWHPGDFTQLGAISRAVAYFRELTPRRDALPDGFEPQLDDSTVDAILSKLPEGVVGDELVESIEHLAADSQEYPPRSRADYQESLDEFDLDSEHAHESAHELLTEDDGERALSALTGEADGLSDPDTDWEVVSETPSTEGMEDEEAFPELPELEAEEVEEPAKPDPLAIALQGAGVDPEGMLDIQSLLNRLDSYDTPLVPVPELTEEDFVNYPADLLEDTAAEDTATEEPAGPEASPAAEPAVEPSELMEKDDIPVEEQVSVPEDEPLVEQVTTPEMEAEPAAGLDQELAGAESTADDEPQPLPGFLSQEEMDELIKARKGSSVDEEARGEAIEPDASPIQQEMTEPLTDAKEMSEPPTDADQPAEQEFASRDAADLSRSVSEITPAPSKDFDIDRWFAARREKRVREQAMPVEERQAQPENEPESEPEQETGTALDRSEPEVDRVEPAPVELSDSEIEAESITEQDWSEPEEVVELEAPAGTGPLPETEPTHFHDESDTPASPREDIHEPEEFEPARPVAPLENGEVQPPVVPHRKRTVEGDEIAPEEIRGPVTKTFARLYLKQGKFEHAAEIVRRLLEESPADPEVLAIQDEIDSTINR